jgi:uncharacterized protein YndB with AHSA1/START domain
MDEGRLMRDEEGTARLVFDRFYPHPRERIWQAILDADQRGMWFFPGTLEAIEGSTVDLVDSAHGVQGKVTRVIEGELLEFSWSSIDAPGSVVSFELMDAPGGTRLIFTHRLTPACRPRNLAPGWHHIFDDLAEYLTRGEVGDRPGRWAELKAVYADQM